jgi:hypothetical protein
MMNSRIHLRLVPEHNNQINKEAVLRDCSYYYGRYLHSSDLGDAIRHTPMVKFPA